MKQTIKASISRYAFTFDTDAYEALDKYLQDLKYYYANKDSGSEIIGDIEDRMSELLRMQLTPSSNIITISEASRIIQLMGNPKDFDDNSETDNTSSSNQKKSDEYKEYPFYKKRIFRDSNNAIIAGVCSGLGKYFRVDPVLIRIGYILGIFILNFVFNQAFAWLIGLYFILWIAMPKAKTFGQKIAMSGKNPSVDAIEMKTDEGKNIRGGNISRIILKTIKTIVGIALTFLGIGLIIASLSVVFLSETTIYLWINDILGIFPEANKYLLFRDMLDINGLNRISLILPLVMTCLIPALMVFYFVIRLFIKIRLFDILVLGLLFAVWIGFTGYIGSRAIEFSKDYKKTAYIIEKRISTIASDTVFIRMDESLKNAQPIDDVEYRETQSQLYVANEDKRYYFFAPKITINESDEYKDILIEIKKTAFDRNQELAEQKARSAKLEIEEASTNIILKPKLYDKDNLWNREFFEVTINTPKGKKIIIDKNYPIISNQN